ncbi:MAG: hypothetical protein EAZ20_03405 [Bacteroidetes bacterium]|jgi:hypothetical protein|nr:MAG: hypothetical protein EAZ20_03405 [Bacteroidota bacterium]
MRLQVIQDGYGANTGIFVPMNDWNTIIQKHEDLKDLVNIEPSPKKKLSELAGKLSAETADAMQKYVEESRNEWETSHQLEFAANALYSDYKNDKELTAFTSLDFEHFYEAK